MVVLIEFIASLVIYYSLGYAGSDRGKVRLVVLVMIFKLAMVTLVISSNLLTLFIG